MARAKAKPRGANRYSPPKKTSAPSWIWLVAGVIIGGFVVFLMKLDPKHEIRTKSTATNNTTGGAKSTNNKNKKPKFEFDYEKMLQGKEPPKLTEEQRKELDGQRAADILAGKPTTTPTQMPAQTPPVSPPPQKVSEPTKPVVIDNSTPASTAKPKVDQVTPTNTTVASTTTATPLNTTRFFLQVGSYPNKNSAESIRAQILMTGKDARIEQTKTNNKSWFRVLVGPYKTREDASKNQQQLSSSGFKGTLIIPRKVQ